MPPSRANRWLSLRPALAVCGVLALSACAAKYAQVPARLDLEPYGRVALAEFTVEDGDSGMSRLATARFAEQLLASQGIELLELPASDTSLSALGDRDVPAVFLGRLRLGSVRPRGQVGGGTMNLRGTVRAELDVRLVSTRTGGTLWRSSSTTDATLGGVRVGRGLPSVAVRDREEAYGEMLAALVTDVTRDLRPTWVRQ